MKNEITKTIIFCIAIAFLASCSTVKVTYPVKYSNKIDKIAVTSTYLGVYKPVLPLIDAAVMNERINSIAPEITNTLEENIDVLRETIARLLKEDLNCEVLYGSALHENPNFDEVKKNFSFEESLVNENRNFPGIVSSSGDLIPFDFNNGKIVPYFKDPKNYKYPVSEICNKLGVNYLFVSVSMLIPVPGSLMVRSKIALNTYMYLLNKDGECIANGRNVSKTVPYTPDEIEGYQLMLDAHSEVFTPVISKMVSKYK
jgi:hypothetical protein